MTKDIVIRTAGLSKCYNIYDQPRNRLLQGLQALWRGKTQYARKFWALSDISFEVKRGECLGILGRNGAGKSTLLQLIAKTLEPTSGAVEVKGMVAALLELGSGFNPEFTGRENVYLNASILGLRDEEIERKFDDIAAFADIGDFIEQPVKTYSSGMMMRLAFAVQTAVEPDILIVDEALAVGDARFQKKCFDRMYRLRENGGTILFVTHDSGTVVQICDRAMILDSGRLYSEGDPQTMARVYHRLLFGSPEQVEIVDAVGTPVSSKTGDSATLKDLPCVREEETRSQTPVMHYSQKEVRYGSREIEIIDIGIRDKQGQRVTLLESHHDYDFYCIVRYNHDVHESVVFGFIVSNVKGLEIYGTKSGLYNLYLRPGYRGGEFECTMSLKAALVPGAYFLTVAIARSEETTSDKEDFFDYRFDALEFHIIGNPRVFTTSLVDLNARLACTERATVGCMI